ncbi:hypothetical protein BGX24_004848 [Mortierella sp. AD032]|nr:hypothetical protein BGX24_004848 [Mortierella sp. AD032]
MTIPTSRSVKLMLCPMDEWPDSLYADESLILPAITSIEFSSYGLATKEPRMMSTYGQARLVRRCVNLKHLYWYAGDYRMDVARTHRWGIQDRNDADWFFGGLLGDTPEGPRKQWKIGDGDAENEKEDEGERWSLPCLESIETVWKEVPDATIARLLKRLHRLTNLRLTSPSFGPLAFQELVRERVPFRAKVPTTLNNDHRDSASPLPPPTLPPPTLLPRRLCNTVIALDISTCVLLSSDNILELLESCPIVETFRAGLVNMSQIAKRQDWACTRVKHLTLKILFDKPHQDVAGAGIGDDDIHRFVTPATANSSISTVEATAAAETTITKEQHRAVFAQLARLHHLKNFDFTSWNARPDKLELQLKLDYGLDLLSTWGSSIETLRFGFRFPQNIILEDAQWILDHWPRLKAAVCCKFHPDDEVNQQIRDVLTAGGVSLGRFQTF